MGKRGARKAGRSAVGQRRSAPAKAAGHPRSVGLSIESPHLATATSLLHLQREAGNRAVTSLLSRMSPLQRLAESPGVARLAAARHLTVGAEDSAAEREAEAQERGADQPATANAIAATALRSLAPERSPLAAGGGAELAAPLRRSMESSLGRDLSAVRVHQDGDTADMNAALGAEAFTHGTDIFASRDVSAGTLRHEVAHAATHSGSNLVHCKAVKKHLDFIRIKKKNTQIGRMLGAKILAPIAAVNKKARAKAEEWESLDHYGHWWVEIGGSSGGWTPIESYGWWPEKSVGYKETLKLGKRVDGKINQDGGRLDPHHGDTAEEDYWPVMAVDDKAPYDQVRDEVVGKVRQFAADFKGSWNWRLAWGKNCHTFVDRLKGKLGLHHQSAKEWLRGGGVAAMPLKHTDPDVIAGMMTDPDGFVDLTLAEIQLLQPKHRRQIVEFYMGLDEPMSWQELNEVLEHRFGEGAAIFKHSDKPLPKPQGEALVTLPEQPKNDVQPPKSENPAKTIKLYHQGWALAGTENDPANLEVVGAPMPGIVLLKWNHNGGEVPVIAGAPDWQRFTKAHEEAPKQPTVVEKPLPPQPTTVPEDPHMTLKLYGNGWKPMGTENNPLFLEFAGSPMQGMVLLKWTRGGEEHAVLAGMGDWRNFRKAHGLAV